MRHHIIQNERELISIIEICRVHKCSRTIFRNVAGPEDHFEINYLKKKSKIILYYEKERIEQVVNSNEFKNAIKHYIENCDDEIVQKDIFDELGWSYNMIKRFYFTPDRQEDNPGGEWLRKQNIRSTNQLLRIMQTPEFEVCMAKSIEKSRNHENRPPSSYNVKRSIYKSYNLINITIHDTVS